MTSVKSVELKCSHVISFFSFYGIKELPYLVKRKGCDGSVTLRFQLFVLIKHLYRSRALPYQQCNVRTIIFVLCASRHPSLHMKTKTNKQRKV